MPPTKPEPTTPESTLTPGTTTADEKPTQPAAPPRGTSRTTITPQTMAPRAPGKDRRLKANGPTLEEFVTAGYDPSQYPPTDFAEVDSDALRYYRTTGNMPGPGEVVELHGPTLDDGSTHFLIRSHTDRFRRAGLSFSRAWQAVAIAKLTAKQIDQLEVEGKSGGMLDVRHASEDEAEEYTSAEHIDETASPAQLRQMLLNERQRADTAESALKALQESLAGGLPPSKGMMPDGTPIGR